MCVPEHNPKDLLPVTFEKSFKSLFVSVLGGNHQHLFRCRISRASNSWLCVVVHSEPLDQKVASERHAQMLNTALRCAWNKGKTSAKLTKP
jgi:hypothetical protein